MGVRIPPGLLFHVETSDLNVIWCCLMITLKETYIKALHFLRDVRSELRKVTFPSRKETIASTLVVLGAVGIISVYLGIVDFGLSVVLHSILR